MTGGFDVDDLAEAVEEGRAVPERMQVTLTPPLIDVHTGELLPATPVAAAELLQRLAEYERLIRTAKRECERILVEASEQHGTKTLRYSGRTFQVYTTKEITWDMAVLRELTKAGLPEERWDELVTTTIEEKVSASVANQLAASNDEYREIIERARRDTESEKKVRVK